MIEYKSDDDEQDLLLRRRARRDAESIMVDRLSLEDAHALFREAVLNDPRSQKVALLQDKMNALIQEIRATKGR